METTDTALDEKIGAQPLQPTLRLVYSGAQGLAGQQTFVLATGPTLIGRAPPAPRARIELPSDHRVSRCHAVVRREGRRLHVTDEGSKNGVFLNGQRVAACELADGDVLRVGDSFFVVRMEDSVPAGSEVCLPTLVGSSLAARSLRRRLAALAPESATVLLLGETGTGKEVAARALHALSRRTGDFVAVNCGALPLELAESLLFGHVAGAFSGAHRAQLGFFRAADRGTLFLDEIGDLPLPLQPKLLRLLEERVVTPVGATTPVAGDVRIVAATNRPLTRAVQLQEFRPDLYARLAEIPLLLVPLRQRREDILPLVAHALGERAPRITPRLAAALLCHPWPFNIRDLFKVVSQLRVLTPSGEPYDLQVVAERLASGIAPQDRDAEAADAGSEVPQQTERALTPDQAQRRPAPSREELAALLTLHRGSISRVARAVGRSRRQVDRWMATLGLASKPYRD